MYSSSSTARGVMADSPAASGGSQSSSSSSSSLLQAASAVSALTAAKSDTNAPPSAQLPYDLYDALTFLRLEAERVDESGLSDKNVQRSVEELFEKLTTYSSSNSKSNTNATECQRLIILNPPLRRALIGTLVALYLRGDRLPLYARVSMLQGPLSDTKATRDSGPEAHFRPFLFACLAALHAKLPDEVKKGAKDSFNNAFKHIKSSSDTTVKVKALELAAEAIRSLESDSSLSHGSGSGNFDELGNEGGGGKGVAAEGSNGTSPRQPGSPTSSSSSSSLNSFDTIEIGKLVALAMRDKTWTVRRSSFSVIEAAGEVSAKSLWGRRGEFDDCIKMCLKGLDDTEWQVQYGAAMALGALIAAAPSHGAAMATEELEKGIDGGSVKSKSSGSMSGIENSLVLYLVQSFGRSSNIKRGLFTRAWLALLSSKHLARKQKALPLVAAICFQICDAVDEAREEHEGRSSYLLGCIDTIVTKGALPKMQEEEQMLFISYIIHQIQIAKSNLKHTALLDGLQLVLKAVGHLSTDEDGTTLREKITKTLMKSISYESNSSVRLSAARTLRSLTFCAPTIAATIVDAEFKSLTNAVQQLRKKEAVSKSAAAVHGHAMALASILSIATRLPLGLPRRLTSASIKFALDMISKGSAIPERQVAWQIIAAAVRSVDSSILMSFRSDILDSLRMSLPSKAAGQLEKVRGGGNVLNPELVWRCSALETISALNLSSLIHDTHSEGAQMIRRYLLKLLTNAIMIVSRQKKLVSMGANPSVMAALTLQTLRPMRYLFDNIQFEKPLLDALLSITLSFLQDTSSMAACSILGKLLEASDSVLDDSYDFFDYSLSKSSSFSVVLPENPWEFEMYEHASHYSTTSAAPSSLDKDSKVGFNRSLLVELANNNIIILRKLFSNGNEETQLKILSQIESTMQTASKIKDKNSDHRGAIMRNVSASLLSCIKTTKSIATAVAEKARNVCRMTLAYSGTDTLLQRASAELLAQSTRLTGDKGVTSVCKALVQELTTAIDPGVRSALALGLGCLHRCVGGMALSPFVSSTVDALVKIASEPIGGAHRWALYSLSLVADSAGLSFMQHVRTSLDLSVALLMKESLYQQNLILSVASVVNSTIGVLGPELVPKSKTFIRQAGLISENEFVDSDAASGSSMHISGAMEKQRILYIQQLLLFAPQAVPIAELIYRVALALFSSQPEVRKIAIVSLRQLIEKDVTVIDRRWNMEYVLFSMLDKEKDTSISNTVKNTILSLCSKSCPASPGLWISSLSRIALGQPRLAEQSISNENVEDDEDFGEMRIENQDTKKASSTSIKMEVPEEHLSKGSIAHSSTRAFAASCLSELPGFIELANDDRHFDLEKALAMQRGDDSLILHLGEMFSLGYKFLMSNSAMIQECGMKFLVAILRQYGNTHDPEFDGHPLLEQYQAQIISVLRTSLAVSAQPRHIVYGSELAVGFILGGLSGGDVGVLKRILSHLLSHLKQWDEAQYSDYAEWCSATVRVSLLEAFARLSAEEAFHSEYYEQESTIIENELSASYPVLIDRWLAFLFDYVILCGQNEKVKAQYQPQLYNGASVDATKLVLTRYEEAVPSVLACLVKYARHNTLEVSLAKCMFTAANLCIRKSINDASMLSVALPMKKIQSALSSITVTLEGHSVGDWLHEQHALELIDLLGALSAITASDIQVQKLIASVVKALGGITSQKKTEKVQQYSAALAYRCGMTLANTSTSLEKSDSEMADAIKEVMSALYQMCSVDVETAQGILALAMEFVRKYVVAPNFVVMIDNGLLDLIVYATSRAEISVKECCISLIGQFLNTAINEAASSANLLSIFRVLTSIGVSLISSGEENDRALIASIVSEMSKVLTMTMSTNVECATALLQSVREKLKDNLQWASTCVVELIPIAVTEAYELLSSSSEAQPLDVKQVSFISECIKVLLLFSSSVVEKIDEKKAVLEILIPLLIMAMSPDPPAAAHPALAAMSIQLITHMATTAAPGFKEVVASLPMSSKQKMQRGLQQQQQSSTSTARKPSGGGFSQAASRQRNTANGTGSSPSINLKMNFLANKS